MRTIPGNIRKPQRNEGSFHSKKLKELCTSAVSGAILPLLPQSYHRALARPVGWLRECGFVDSTRGVTRRSDIARWDLQRGPARDQPAGLERCSGDFPD